MYVMVVSLAFDQSRREKISSVMNDLNIEFPFVDAIYGRDLSKEEKETIPTQIFEKRCKHKPSDAVLGCTLSHIKAYEIMLEKGLEWTCILEDDVILDEKFGQFISEINEGKLEQNTLYILGGQDGLRYRHKVVFNFFKNKILGGQLFKKVSYGHGYVVRSCCYLASKNIVKNIIDELKIDFFAMDEWKYLMRKNVFSNMYFSDLVHHPLDLSDSWIEKERRSGIKNKKTTKSKNRILISRMYWYVRRGIMGFVFWK